jgi:hypothetical protein
MTNTQAASSTASGTGAAPSAAKANPGTGVNLANPVIFRKILLKNNNNK